MRYAVPPVPTVPVLIIASLLTACAITPREAEPLPIEKVRRPVRVEPPMIRRGDLQEVLSKGPGRFLARMPVEPYRASNRSFVGFRVLALYGGLSPHPEGVHVGDVVTAINKMPIARPEQFMKVWEGAAAAPVIEVDLIRSQQPMRIVYRIVD
ncbi:MAG: type II secretory pathway component PulC [Myxococcota bacterium]|jgi:type II secretory pathway component PulC